MRYEISLLSQDEQYRVPLDMTTHATGQDCREGSVMVSIISQDEQYRGPLGTAIESEREIARGVGSPVLTANSVLPSASDKEAEGNAFK